MLVSLIFWCFGMFKSLINWIKKYILCLIPSHLRILFTGRPIIVDFSPVTDFREATCRQYEENTCNRGGYCNFMHLKRISR